MIRKFKSVHKAIILIVIAMVITSSSCSNDLNVSYTNLKGPSANLVTPHASSTRIETPVPEDSPTIQRTTILSTTKPDKNAPSATQTRTSLSTTPAPTPAPTQQDIKDNSMTVKYLDLRKLDSDLKRSDIHKNCYAYNINPVLGTAKCINCIIHNTLLKASEITVSHKVNVAFREENVLVCSYTDLEKEYSYYYYNLNTNKFVKFPPKLYVVCMSDNGDRIFYATEKDNAYIFDTKTLTSTKAKIDMNFNANSLSIDLLISNDGKYLCYSDYEESLVYDIDTKETMKIKGQYIEHISGILINKTDNYAYQRIFKLDPMTKKEVYLYNYHVIHLLFNEKTKTGVFEKSKVNDYFYNYEIINFKTGEHRTLITNAKFKIDKSRRYIFFYSIDKLNYDKIFCYNIETGKITTHKLKSDDVNKISKIYTNIDIMRLVRINISDDNKSITISI